MTEQILLFFVLALTMSFFVWGKIRYEVVALIALITLALFNVVPFDQVFVGFSHPAVIIVVAVLVLSKGLMNSGMVDGIGRRLSSLNGKPFLQVVALTLLATVLSAFIYNVGALALLMPIAIRMARKSNVSPALFLMPVAFGTHLGGFLLVISAIPNVIIATFRTQAGLEPFAMFDFAKVGIWLAILGVMYISLIGWRLMPRSKARVTGTELFNIEGYMTELRVRNDSRVVGLPIKKMESLMKGTLTVVALIRNEHKIMAPSRLEILREHDVLLIRAEQEVLNDLIEATGLELIGSQDLRRGTLGTDDVKVVEAVVYPDSLVRGQNAFGLNLRWKYGVNLIAVARHNKPLTERLDNIVFRSTDVLLLQGEDEKLQSALSELKLLPLAEREVSLGKPQRVILALAIFASAVLVASFGLLPIEIVFSIAAIIMVLFGFVSAREAYHSIDWSVVFLLGAMIPIGIALETSGGAVSIAGSLFFLSEFFSPVFLLVLVLVVSMLLCELVNTAGATILMAPIAILIAQSMGVSVDPFLMAVAIGGSTAFMTPIGHQANTLVMRPGGYKFGDYWRMGLPLNILILLVSIPLILFFWPL
jgi:di/tricarboxylate transporter